MKPNNNSHKFQVRKSVKQVFAFCGLMLFTDERVLGGDLMSTRGKSINLFLMDGDLSPFLQTHKT